MKVVKKAIGDFEKLPEKWDNLNNYYFVYNDRYSGAPAPLVADLQKLKKDYGLSNAKAIVGAELEAMFMALDPSTRQVIVGGIPSCDISYIDPRNIRVVPVDKLLILRYFQVS